MAKMRMNMLMVHNYTDEIYHNFPIDGKLPRVTLSHTKSGYMIGGPGWFPWAYRFKGRDLIDDCDFGAESALHAESFTNEEVFARGVTMFQRVIAYAHSRGVRIALWQWRCAHSKWERARKARWSNALSNRRPRPGPGAIGIG